jgi:GTP-binding protein
MFIDEKELLVTAGKGGDGAALFRREIYVPRGGPDGGDGGRGGDVYVVGKNNLHALSHLAALDSIKAEDGAKGGHQKSTGKSGDDQIIAVPLGTVVMIEKEKGWESEIEIIEEDVPHLLVKGGNGGWGNWRYRSSINQAPDRFNPGLPGQEKRTKLILKLIADIGLVGLPNAGKSTLLSVVSAARPKIANYPFTTLEPQLGVVELKTNKETRQWVMADLPGLIEGASQGKGLGASFLKHVERTKSIVHCIDASSTLEEMAHNYDIIRKELNTWSEVLANKPELIALTKIDLLLEEELSEKITALEKLTKKKVYPISSVAHVGLEALLAAIPRES